MQSDMVASFADRAEAVRGGGVDPREDNMLTITNNGRKLALDQRLINPLFPDEEDSKVNRCVKNVFTIWRDTTEDRLTQIIFCDLSTPKGDGSFNVYDDMREKLVGMGIPREEVAFIHEANTETRKSNYLQGFVPGRYASCSVSRRNSAQGPIYRTGWWHCIISTAHGSPQIWTNRKDESCARETGIRR